MGICMSSAFTAHGRPKKPKGQKKSAKSPPAGHSSSGECMPECIKQAGRVLAGPLLAISVVGFTAAGCAQEEDLPAADVDQPSPTDWQSQGALMTAPSKAPRTIAAMMFDIGGGVPDAADDHERRRRHRVVAAAHVPGDLVRHPGHAARVLRSVHAAGEQLPDHRLLRPVLGQDRQRRDRPDATWTRSARPSITTSGSTARSRRARTAAPGATKDRPAASPCTRATRSTRSSATRRRSATTSA